MATLPIDELKIIEQFGPHLARMSGEQLSTAAEPDHLVKTHCCFCGQQCGIQLKVKDNQVIGFEPWEEFPFNRGMLCHKGVKRYLQGSHPDRLLSALRRDPTAPGGFAPLAYSEAIAEVASEIQRIQQLTARDIQRLAQRYLDIENFVLAIVSKRERLDLTGVPIPAEAIRHGPVP